MIDRMREVTWPARILHVAKSSVTKYAAAPHVVFLEPAFGLLVWISSVIAIVMLAGKLFVGTLMPLARLVLLVTLTVAILGELSRRYAVHRQLSTETARIVGAYMPYRRNVPYQRPESDRRFNAFFMAISIMIGRKNISNVRQLSRPNALRSIVIDARPPVFYLRSFSDDRTSAIIDPNPPVWEYDLLTKGSTREALFARELEKVGPVIAVSPPAEDRPLLGAARFYAPPDEWKLLVARTMSISRIVVIRLGEGGGL